MPSITGVGWAHTGEGFHIRGPRAAWWPRMQPVPVIIYCHGATGVTSTVLSHPEEMHIIYELSKFAVVLISDLGGDTYNNDTAIARLEEARLSLASLNIDTSQPIGLVGASMGAGVSLAYARAFPSKVAYVAGIIPFLDIADVRDNNRGGLAAGINAAYGGLYVDSTHGPTHSPVRFATGLPTDLPIALWTASNDTYTVPATATEFTNLRPQTVRTDVGALDHTMAAIAASTSGVVSFCKEHAAQPAR